MHGTIIRLKSHYGICAMQRPLWNVSFAYTAAILLINYKQEERKTDSQPSDHLLTYITFFMIILTRKIFHFHIQVCVCVRVWGVYLNLISLSAVCFLHVMRLVKPREKFMLYKNHLRKTECIHEPWTKQHYALHLEAEEEVVFSEDEITKYVQNM